MFCCLNKGYLLGTVLILGFLLLTQIQTVVTTTTMMRTPAAAPDPTTTGSDNPPVTGGDKEGLLSVSRNIYIQK